MMTRVGLLDWRACATVRPPKSEIAMATLSITELAETANDRGVGLVQALLTFTSAAQSAAFGARTRKLRCHSSATVHILVGANPTATAANSPRFPAGEFFVDVAPGQKLSAYDGTLDFECGEVGGTEFFFELPIARPGRARNSKENE